MNTKAEAITGRANGSLMPEQCSAKQPNGVYRRILLGVDLSPTSTPVFEHALKLAIQNKAELLMVHAFEISGNVSFMPPECYDQWLLDYQAQAAKKIKLLMNQARQAGVRCHAVLVTGLPEDAIAAAVRKTKIDLVVIGTHGRHGLSRFLSGSIASRIIPLAGCPVLTVRVAPSEATRAP